MEAEWYRLHDPSTVPSPALLVYPDRVRANVQEMIRVAGSAARLRPHIKTHKCAEIVDLQLNAGIRQFKCATLGEAELLGNCGAPDVLLAMQLVGPHVAAFASLAASFKQTKWAALVDNVDSARALSQAVVSAGVELGVFIDLNVGMDRTGIKSGAGAVAVFAEAERLSHLRARGLHAYDGHIRDTDRSVRTQRCIAAFEPVVALRQNLATQFARQIELVAGGSGSFPVHAEHIDAQLSPGTTLLWDAGYARIFPEQRFQPAVALLTRVISQPDKTRYCFDLGHKSVAPEMAPPRLQFLDVKGLREVGHSEEHLVVESSTALDLTVGSTAYALPVHVCPTVAKYPAMYTVEKGHVTGHWDVAARDAQPTVARYSSPL